MLVKSGSNFTFIFVWDFLTPFQDRRYFFIYLFTRYREPSVCHVVSIKKREDPGNETLGMSVCVWRPFHVSVTSRIISTCFLGTINLQGKEKYLASCVGYIINILHIYYIYISAILYIYYIYIARSHCTLVYKSR